MSEGDGERLDGNKFLQLHEQDPARRRDFGVAICASNQQHETLATCRTIICDETFKAASTPYYQLYVIFG